MVKQSFDCEEVRKEINVMKWNLFFPERSVGVERSGILIETNYVMLPKREY